LTDFFGKNERSSEELRKVEVLVFNAISNAKPSPDGEGLVG
jgi:hypothetical protein